MKPRTPLEGAFALELPCPNCGESRLLGFLYLNQHGKHMHTHYVCTFWKSEEDPGVYMDPDHDSTVNRCGWHGWVVPEPLKFPTAAGSVIEASRPEDGEPGLWMRTEVDDWVNRDGYIRHDGDLSLSSVLFDAGAGE
jgi:hypothetical protein